MKSNKIIMDMEDALYADVEEFKKDSERLDWLIENNKISFNCTSRDDIDVVIEQSGFINNLKPKNTESN